MHRSSPEDSRLRSGGQMPLFTRLPTRGLLGNGRGSPSTCGPVKASYTLRCIFRPDRAFRAVCVEDGYTGPHHANAGRRIPTMYREDPDDVRLATHRPSTG